MDFSGQAPSLSLSWVSQENHAPPYRPPTPARHQSYERQGAGRIVKTHANGMSVLRGYAEDNRELLLSNFMQ